MGRRGNSKTLRWEPAAAVHNIPPPNTAVAAEEWEAPGEDDESVSGAGTPAASTIPGDSICLSDEDDDAAVAEQRNVEALMGAFGPLHIEQTKSNSSKPESKSRSRANRATPE